MRIQAGLFYLTLPFLIFSTTLQATTVPGITPGELSVSQSGAAMYSIPIDVPPGTAGMQPGLSLDYSSQGGNGLLGVGWSLGGLSVIHRCPQTQAQDGQRQGITYTADDRFCIDGQRLMLISGTYGAANSEYRTEIDGYSKVVAYGTAGSGPAYFKVWTKSGQVMEYGNTADARIEAQGKSEARLWAVNRIEDTVSNYLTVSYFEDSNTGEYYPTQMDYSGNSSAGTAPDNSVVFGYENRSDSEVSFQAGSKQTQSKRLIKVVLNQNSNLIQEYKLVYLNDSVTGRSRLDTIQQCNASNECFSEINLAWSNRTTTFEPVKDYGNGGGSGYWTNHTMATTQTFQFTGDFNGDGITDFMFYPGSGIGWRVLLGSENGFEPEQNWGFGGGTGHWVHHTMSTSQAFHFTGDFNGDGKTDFMYFGQSGGWRVLLSNGSGFEPEQNWGSGGGVGYWGNWPMGTTQSFHHTGDFNGDGRTDFMFYPGSGSGWRVLLSNGSGFEPEQNWGSGGGLGHWGNHTMSGSQPFQFTGDFNGDGMTDFMFYPQAGSGWRVLLSNGSSFGQEQNWGSGGGLGHWGHWQWSTSQKFHFVDDFNGDGISDFMFKANAGQGNIVLLSNGSSFEPEQNWGSGGGLGYWGNWTSSTIQPFHLLGDYNGDGKTDYMLRNSTTNSWDVLLSEHGQFSQLQDRGNGGGVGHWPNYTSTTTQSFQFQGDFNGDGQADFMYWDSGWKLLSTSTINPDLLISITTSTGASTNITYKPLTDNSVYTKGSGATYPEIDLQTPMYVVSQVDSDDGIGGMVTTEYTYAGLKADYNGRGLLGFASMTTTDVTTGIKTTSHYRQDFPYTGQVTRSEKHLADGTLIYELDNTYASHSYFGDTVHTPYVTQSIEKSHELDGTLTSTVTTVNTYPSTEYGSPTHITVTTADAAGNAWVTDTTNTYTHNTGAWHLGRLTNASVTKTLPDGSNATRASSFEYDAISGLLTVEKIEPGTADELVTTTTYDAFGNKIAVTISSPVTDNSSTPGNEAIVTRTTTTSYDPTADNDPHNDHLPQGRFATRTTNALGHTETRSYDPRFGVVTHLTGPNGLTTTWTYDGFGRRLSENRADGTSTTWQYNFTASGCPVNETALALTETVSGAAPATVCKDRLDREISKVAGGFDGTPIYTYTTYNPRGQVDHIAKPYYQGDAIHYTQYTYDTLGRVLQETNPDNSQTTTVYNGLSTTITNDQGQSTTRLKNAIGQQIKVTDPQGHDAHYQYDPHGNLIQTTDEAGHITTMGYDIRGNKTSMDDPDMGQWQYHYNVLGELISQVDAKNQSVTLTYDKLGRMVSRIEAEGTTTWQYDTATHGIGKLHSVTAPAGTAGYSMSYSYDSDGRPSSTTTTLGGNSYTHSTTYDTYSRVDTQTYPTGFKTRNIYNDQGHLSEVHNEAYYAQVTGLRQEAAVLNGLADQVDTLSTTLGTCSVPGEDQWTHTELQNLQGAQDQRAQAYRDQANLLLLQADQNEAALTPQQLAPIWTLNAKTAEGLLQTYTYGNGIQTNQTWQAQTNRLTQIEAGNPNGTGREIQHQQMTYDSLGNLTGKTNHNAQDNNGNALSETYSYDTLNRLSSAVNYLGSTQFTYDALGNITYKTGVGTYSYGNNAGPHAVTGVTNGTHTTTYSYDANGAMTGNSDGRAVVWSSYNKPVQMSHGSHSEHFLYGADRKRIHRDSYSHAILTKSTTYIGSQYEKQIEYDATGAYQHTKHVHYINGGGKRIAIYEEKDTGTTITTETKYLHHDHQGSTVAITNSSGALLEQLDYNCHGGRRNLDWTAASTPITSSHTDRGYTDHEHLDHIGLIHMNGRVYDPTLGRFLSADPHIQFPGNMQSWNRYSYVLNNPHSYTDPSGFFLKKLFKSVKKLVKKVLSNKVVRLAAAIAISYFAPGSEAIFGEALAGSTFAYAASGFAAGLVGSGGDLRAGIAGAFSGALLSGWAHGLDPGVGKILAHGAISGVASKIQGGKFASGFISGAFTQSISGKIEKWFPGEVNRLPRTIASAVAGGVASTLGGGKFANGALTGAFSRLFNDEVRWKGKNISGRTILEEPVGKPYKIIDHGAWKDMDVDIPMKEIFAIGRALEVVIETSQLIYVQRYRDNVVTWAQDYEINEYDSIFDVVGDSPLSSKRINEVIKWDTKRTLQTIPRRRSDTSYKEREYGGCLNGITC